MTPALTSLLIFLCISAAGLLVMRLRSTLPPHHLNSETQDTVKLSMGLVATMTALLLGLLVASAKGGYDAQKSGVIAVAAKLIMLDRMLAHYGPEAAGARVALHDGALEMVDRLWPVQSVGPARLIPDTSAGDAAYNAIESLAPKDEAQRTIKAQLVAGMVALGETRWLLFEQTGRSISPPMLVILVCWLAILFGSFGLFAPANGTAVCALVTSAAAVSAAILLILELDQPFGGFIRISSAALHVVVDHLGK